MIKYQYLGKASKLVILMIMSFCLIGCGAQDKDVLKNQGNLQEQENSQELEDTQVQGNSLIQENLPNEEDSASQEDRMEEEKVNTELEFRETDELVYATVNVNIRSSYTTTKNNVVSILDKGKSVKRIGIQSEWSKVLYQDKVFYIKSDYLTLQKPVVEEVVTKAPETFKEGVTATLSSDEDFVAKLNIASQINQLICVIGNGGSNCTVSFHTKDNEGKWKQQFTIAGDNGSNGISYSKREGDKKTPAGLYSLTIAFGLKADPGAILPYRKITKYDYWVDDINSIYYNTWVNSQETPGEYVSEHLIDHNPSYNYALNINYNSACTPGEGSAMFLHGYNGTGQTTGCIAISEDCMKVLIRTVNSSTRILIVPNRDDLVNY